MFSISSVNVIDFFSTLLLDLFDEFLIIESVKINSKHYFLEKLFALKMHLSIYA